MVLSLSQTIRGLHWDKVPGDNDDEVAARGILYLLIFQQLGQLVRWSWGYNVLLAPPDKYQDTIENTNSQIEGGQARSDEECDRLIDTSVDDDEDEQDLSGSDVTRVEGTSAAKHGSDAPQSGSVSRSGEEDSLANGYHTSSVSPEISASKGFAKPGPAPDLLPTPTNGNVKPAGRIISFPSIGAATGPIDEYIPHGIKGLPVRCKVKAKRAVRCVLTHLFNATNSVFGSLPSPLQRGLEKAYHIFTSFFLGLWSFMNPPLWAMLAAIVVASIPDLQRFFFADGTFFKNSVTSAIRQSGGVAVPLILVVLGGNLARNTLPNEKHTAEDDKEETKLLIASILSRMVLPIVVMAPLLALTAKYVPVSILDDPIFIIVCFLITGAPSALQLAQICQINNVYMGAMSRLLFQSYVVWILPSTLILVMCALEVVEWAQQ